MSTSNSNIRTIIDSLGRSWVEIPDDLWSKKELYTYINGMDVT